MNNQANTNEPSESDKDLLEIAKQEDITDEQRSEAMIDEIIRESFPASDPPPWTSTSTGNKG